VSGDGEIIGELEVDDDSGKERRRWLQPAWRDKGDGAASGRLAPACGVGIEASVTATSRLLSGETVADRHPFFFFLFLLIPSNNSMISKNKTCSS